MALPIGRERQSSRTVTSVAAVRCLDRSRAECVRCTVCAALLQLRATRCNRLRQRSSGPVGQPQRSSVAAAGHSAVRHVARRVLVWKLSAPGGGGCPGSDSPPDIASRLGAARAAQRDVMLLVTNRSAGPGGWPCITNRCRNTGDGGFP